MDIHNRQRQKYALKLNVLFFLSCYSSQPIIRGHLSERQSNHYNRKKTEYTIEIVLEH